MGKCRINGRRGDRTLFYVLITMHRNIKFFNSAYIICRLSARQDCHSLNQLYNYLQADLRATDLHKSVLSLLLSYKLSRKLLLFKSSTRLTIKNLMIFTIKRQQKDMKKINYYLLNMKQLIIRIINSYLNISLLLFQKLYYDFSFVIIWS